MGLNYAKAKPIGNNGQPFFDSPPPASTLAIYTKENAATSSVITLTQDTTAVEISASGSPAYIRWVRTGDGNGAATSVLSSAAASNYDHVVNNGDTRYFIVPVEAVVANGYSSMVGANRDNGLYRRLAFKTNAAGSVLVIEK